MIELLLLMLSVCLGVSDSELLNAAGMFSQSRWIWGQ